MFANRKYRLKSNRQGLTQFSVTVKESDLHIQAKTNLSKIATKKILELRGFIEEYAKMDPQFITSLVPIEPLIAVVPEIVADMVDAAKKAGVGPMAAVAGAIAQHTGVELLKYSSEVIVENGGDIFFKINSHMVF
ncbi:MAG: UPF0280 family protein, partial [Desulfamplus sp.]|nr:UPF0280 family protein [Desulfamplus sp.]